MGTKELIDVLSHYELSPWRKGRALHGATSTNTVIHTPQGSLVLKKKRGHLSSRTVQEHALLEYLADAEIQVPRLIRNTAGSTYTETLDSHYTLTKLIEGMSFVQCNRHLDTDEAMIRDAGSSLAHLHKAIVSIPSDGELGRHVEKNPPDMAWRLKVIDRLCEQKPDMPGGDSGFMLEIADSVRQQLLAAQKCYRAADPAVPVQLVHFDYSPKNLVFGLDGSITGILDFGNTCVDLRIADLERFIFSFRPSICHPPSERVARIFLNAYRRQQNLSDEEIRRIPDFASWRRLRQITRIMDASLRPRNDPRRRRFARRRVTVKELWADTSWLKEHTNMIADKLIGMTEA